MSNRRFAGCLLGLVCLLGPTCGCQALHSDRPPLAVLVRDAETKKPIATAEVYVCQHLKQDEVAPCHSKAFTQADGVARVQAEAPGENGLQVQAVAQGYLPEKQNVTAEWVNARRQPASQAKPAKKDNSAPDLVMDVYAEPGFSVELVLPPGYRGLVKVDIQLQDNLPLPPGQRCFRYAVAPSGDVVVRGPTLLQRVPPADFRARYASGPLLSTAIDADRVGFRWLQGAGSRHYFVAGTQVDYETVHARLMPEDARRGGDGSPGGQRHKYRYGKITAPNYENK